jgi:hypothetical protein
MYLFSAAATTLLLVGVARRKKEPCHASIKSSRRARRQHSTAPVTTCRARTPAPLQQYIYIYIYTHTRVGIMDQKQRVRCGACICMAASLHYWPACVLPADRVRKAVGVGDVRVSVSVARGGKVGAGACRVRAWLRAAARPGRGGRWVRPPRKSASAHPLQPAHPCS